MKKKKGKTEVTDDDVKKDDEEQSQRFVETARNVESDISEMKFSKLVSSIRNKQPKPSDT